MHITKDDFSWAASQGYLAENQVDPLWNALEKQSKAKPHFDLLYYVGALLVISSMGALMILGWDFFGGGGILALSLLYIAGFIKGGQILWFKEKLKTAGGLSFTIGVCMIPFAVYGLETLFNWWPQVELNADPTYFYKIRCCYLGMAAATIIASLITLRWIRFPFLLVPLCLSLWYIAVDLSPLFVGKLEWSTRVYEGISIAFGSILILTAYLIDRRTQEDYSFWLYLFGLCSLSVGLVILWSGSEMNKFAFCLISIGWIVLSVLLDRRLFAVIGSLGVFGYLCYLAYQVFEDSLLFPVAITLLGIFIMYLGIQYQRNRERIEAAILARVPSFLRGLLPQERE